MVRTVDGQAHGDKEEEQRLRPERGAEKFGIQRFRKVQRMLVQADEW